MHIYLCIYVHIYTDKKLTPYSAPGTLADTTNPNTPLGESISLCSLPTKGFRSTLLALLGLNLLLCELVLRIY